MCGIVGVVNPDKRHERYRDYCEQGMRVGILRGEDSTGLFQVNKKGGFDTYKMGISGDMFAANKGTVRRLNKISSDSVATIIHNRAATRGEVNDDNAHPFIHFKDEPKGKPKHALVGVHNGTLYGTHPNKEDGRDFEVDSDYLFYQICKLGAKEALKEVRGSYACVWYENNWNLNIAVNEERPLFWGFVQDRNAMLIASEAGMMCWLAERNGIKLETIVAPDKNKIYTFNLKGELRDFEVEDVPAKPIIPVGGGYHSNFPHARGAPTPTTGGATRDSAASSKMPVLNDFQLQLNDVVMFSPFEGLSESKSWVDGMVELPNGDPISAVMHATSPAIIRHLRECEFANVQVRSAYNNNGVPTLIVGHPLEVVSTDSPKPVRWEQLAKQMDEFEQLDDLDETASIPSNMLRGPKGKPITLKTFEKLTENGCIHCHGDCLAKDNAKMEWVNHTNDPLCKSCVEELHERSEARRSVRA